MSFVHDLCDRTVVLNFGRLIYDGPTRGVQDNQEVREAYLGSRRVARTGDRPCCLRSRTSMSAMAAITRSRAST